MKTTEQIIEWINNELKELNKREERALVNPDIESSLESMDNIYPQIMVLNNLLKYIDSPPQSVIKWEHLGDNIYIANYNGYTLRVGSLPTKRVWWWGIFSKSISGSDSIPLKSPTTPETTRKEAMQKCEDYLKEIGVLK